MAPAEFRTGLHPVVFVGASTMAAFVAVATMFVVRNNDLTLGTSVEVALVGGALTLASIVPTLVRWMGARFVVGDRGVSGRVGWLRPHVVDLTWDDIEDVDLEQTAIGRALGYGTVKLLTAAGIVDGFVHVAHAPGLVSAVRDRLRARGRSRTR